MENKIQIERKAWRTLAFVGRVVLLYIDATMYVFLIQLFEPKGFLQLTTCVVIISVTALPLVHAAGRWIRRQYEIKDTPPPPLRPDTYREHGEIRERKSFSSFQIKKAI